MNAPPLLPGAHPVLTCAAARAWEQRILRGDETLEWAAMLEAGSGVAAGIEKDALEIGGIPGHARLLVLCGKGHNGGDALLALHALLDAHPCATAHVVIVPDFAALRPLVRRALERLWQAHGARVELLCASGGPDGSDAARVRARLEGATFAVGLDGLFGLQFAPPLREPASWLIREVNRHRAIALRAAVDVPSGLGDASDEHPFAADFTYATGVAKAPLFGPSGAAAGRIRYLDLGFFDAALPENTGLAVLTTAVLDPLRRLRPARSDKRSFGHLFVVSGSRSMPGAVFMTVQAALLSGVGLVTAFVPESVAGGFAARLPEAMWVPMPETPAGGLALEGRGLVMARATRCTALVAGPGMGREPETLTLVAELLRALEVPAVLDADALQGEVVDARLGRPEPGLVLTPHAGEFERIGGGSAAGDEALRAVAERLRATVVLKGAPSRISDGGDAYISPHGGPALARGGSGDALAGVVAGLLAAGASPLEAAARGVVWHGCAADLMARENGQTSGRATDLVEHLPAVLRAGEGRGR